MIAVPDQVDHMYQGTSGFPNFGALLIYPLPIDLSENLVLKYISPLNAYFSRSFESLRDFLGDRRRAGGSPGDYF